MLHLCSTVKMAIYVPISYPVPKCPVNNATSLYPSQVQKSRRNDRSYAILNTFISATITIMSIDEEQSLTIASSECG